MLVTIINLNTHLTQLISVQVSQQDCVSGVRNKESVLAHYADFVNLKRDKMENSLLQDEGYSNSYLQAAYSLDSFIVLALTHSN